MGRDLPTGHIESRLTVGRVPFHRASIAREGEMEREMVRTIERQKPNRDKAFRVFRLVSETPKIGLITRRS
ncbi:hypothetical protein BMS3Bbin01_00357 [bacterium BMS3Bbin01]|nr:hypothetical protein BMS3Bbin01_00357 [bacterium BMS3Bbin01]